MTETPPDAAVQPVPDAAPEGQEQQSQQRPLRMCDVCGGVDDHPRHVIGFAAGDGPTSDEVAEKALANAQNAGGDAVRNVLAQVRDAATHMRHMDCCRSVGCPDGSCNVVTAGAENMKGDDLVAHLTSRPGAQVVQGEVITSQEG